MTLSRFRWCLSITYLTILVVGVLMLFVVEGILEEAPPAVEVIEVVEVVETIYVTIDNIVAVDMYRNQHYTIFTLHENVTGIHDIYVMGRVDIIDSEENKAKLKKTIRSDGTSIYTEMTLYVSGMEFFPDEEEQ